MDDSAAYEATRLNQLAWNRISAGYQAKHRIPTDSAHYGPWAPPENELRLLGDVQGRRILEIGCGGGQCAIAFAKQGASTAGLDLSETQLEFARELAAAEGVDVPFIQGSAEQLDAFAAGAWDLVFSAYALHYVADMPRCLAECARVLRPHGLLVFSLDHPFRDCFYDAQEDDIAIYPVRSYFDLRPMRWHWAGQSADLLQSHHYPISGWIDMLAAAGFHLRRLLEPVPPADMLDEIWPVDDALAAMRHVPQTIIFVAEKG